MSKDNRNLKIYSILFIFLGLFDLISLAIDYFTGDLATTLENSTSTVGSKEVLIVLAGFVALVAFIELYLGIKGLNQSKGKGKGTTNITIAKVGFVITAILLILDAVEIIRNGGEITSLLSDAIATILLYEYVNVANSVNKK